MLINGLNVTEELLIDLPRIESIPNYFRQDEPIIGLKTALGGNPLRVDRTGDASRTRVSVTRRTIGHGGQMTVGWNRTHSPGRL